MTDLVGIKITDVSSTAQYELGSIYDDPATGLSYRYVQYDTGAGAVAAVAGNFCYYYLAGGTTTNKVTSDLSDSVNIGAGVLKSAPTDGQYCWIQRRGPATLTTALTAGADGNGLTPVGSTDGTLDVTALVTDHICAIADDISAKQVILCCP